MGLQEASPPGGSIWLLGTAWAASAWCLVAWAHPSPCQGCFEGFLFSLFFGGRPCHKPWRCPWCPFVPVMDGAVAGLRVCSAQHRLRLKAVASVTSVQWELIWDLCMVAVTVPVSGDKACKRLFPN